MAARDRANKLKKVPCRSPPNGFIGLRFASSAEHIPPFGLICYVVPFMRCLWQVFREFDIDDGNGVTEDDLLALGTAK